MSTIYQSFKKKFESISNSLTSLSRAGTESIQGLLKISTDAESKAGTIDTKAISPLKLLSVLRSLGIDSVTTRMLIKSGINFIDHASAYSDTNSFYLSSNSENGATRKEANFATRLFLNSADGIIRLQVAPTGLAGSSISWTTVLTLGAGGGLLFDKKISSVSNSAARDELNFPVGSTMIVINQSGVQPDRNAVVTIKLRTDSLSGYTDTGTGAVLAGEWRARGFFSGAQGYYMAERV